MIRIHDFARGARGMRLYWQCEEMGLPYEVAVVPFPPGPDYRALNPLGSVPFLEDTGVAINESVAIMLYLAHRYGPTPLLPAREDPLAARVIQLTVFGETAIGMGLNPLLEAHFAAPEAEKRGWTVRRQEARVEAAIAYVEGILGERSFLAGDALTLADISVSCALGIWKGALGKTLSERLTAWRTNLSERPAYQRALSRRAAVR